MKKTLSVLCALLTVASLSLYASQPLRRIFNHKQSDSTSITVHKVGNRNYCFYATSDRLALVKNTKGDLCYAAINNEGLTASAVRAHNIEERNAAEHAYAKAHALTADECLAHLTPQSNIQIATRALNSSNNGLGIYGSPASGKVTSIGTHQIPVVLVEFADRKFMESNDSAKYSRWFNKTDYNEERGCKSSISQYFSVQSDSLFVPRFNIIGKVCTSNDYAYYGGNTSSGADRHVSTLINEVIDLLENQNIDITPYLENGEVPLMAIIHAGPGEQSSFEDGCEDYIYAHFKETPSLKYNSTSIASYLITCEVMQSYTADTEGNPVIVGAQIEGIGTFVHEFCHALGLPDYYSTNGAADETPGMWAIMDYGQYLYDSYRPAGLGAYERSYLGWLEIEELDTMSAEKQIHPLGTKGESTAYLLRNDANEKEYFILENRQDCIWFPKILGEGMLVTHIDYNSSSWTSNTVNNNARHQRVSIVRADNRYESVMDDDFYDMIGSDLYPGITGNTELSDNSTPATTLFTGNKLEKPIYNIALSNDGVITFSYLDKNIESGIDNVTINPPLASSAIYTIDGRNIENANALPAGTIYIKNGKKHIK